MRLIDCSTHFAPFPYRYRCPFGTLGDQTDQLSLQYLRTLCSDPESGIPKPAAIIVEVVQGEGVVFLLPTSGCVKCATLRNDMTSL
jgi:diaminobutyrate-2-oxoglutarate transaminase